MDATSPVQKTPVLETLLPESPLRKAPLHTIPIDPLIVRHVQDAAWLWSQLPSDACSPLMDRQRAAHFQAMLRCHLEGAAHAGALGWQLALKELARWKGAEQYFVCWHLALRAPTSGPAITSGCSVTPSACAGDAEKMAALLQWLPRLPCLLEAEPGLGDSHAPHPIASALQWSAAAVRQGVITAWLAGDNAVLRAVALHACALTVHEPALASALTPMPASASSSASLLGLPVHEYFQADDAPTLAAACHLAGTLRRRDLAAFLMRAATSPHMPVREAVGLALLRCGLGTEAWPLLREAVLYHHVRATTGEGSFPLREELRAEALARALGHALPNLETLAAQEPLPPHLMLLTLTHLGDARALETLAQCMDEENPYAVRALWALCRITGLAAEDAGLCLPPVLPGDAGYDAELTPYGGRLQDEGLPAPHAEKIRQWLTAHRRDFADGIALMDGKEASRAQCIEALYMGQQDQRLAASWRALQFSPSPQVDTASPMELQQAHMRMLRNS